MRKKSCYTKFHWLNIFPEPIKFRVTSDLHLTSLRRKVCCTTQTLSGASVLMDITCNFSDHQTSVLHQTSSNDHPKIQNIQHMTSL